MLIGLRLPFCFPIRRDEVRSRSQEEPQTHWAQPNSSMRLGQQNSIVSSLSRRQICPIIQIVFVSGAVHSERPTNTGHGRKGGGLICRLL